MCTPLSKLPDPNYVANTQSSFSYTHFFLFMPWPKYTSRALTTVTSIYIPQKLVRFTLPNQHASRRVFLTLVFSHSLLFRAARHAAGVPPSASQSLSQVCPWRTRKSCGAARQHGDLLSCWPRLLTFSGKPFKAATKLIASVSQKHHLSTA